MAQTIEIGTLVMKAGTKLPAGLRLESDPYLKNWSVVKNINSLGLDRMLSAAGWAFFYMAGEVQGMALGLDPGETTRRAVKKAIANMKSDKFNCFEISSVATKSFLGLPRTTVTGHARHIQDSLYLSRPRQIPELDEVKLAAA